MAATAYYTAWFFAFFAVAMLILYLMTSRSSHLRDIFQRVRSQLPALVAVVIAGIVFATPFLWLYVPKAAQTGMHSYSTALHFAPTLLDTFSVGETNVVWGRLVALLDQVLPGHSFSVDEGRTGIPPVLLVLFLIATVAMCLEHARTRPDRPAVLLVVGLAALVTWALCIRVGSHSGWWAVYHAFPGAKAVRAVTRYQIFLVAPVVLIAVWKLSQWESKNVAVAIGLCFLLLIEEANTGAPLGMFRQRETARLNAIGVPPAQCNAFFVASARAVGPGSMDPRLTRR